MLTKIKKNIKTFKKFKGISKMVAVPMDTSKLFQMITEKCIATHLLSIYF